METTSALGLTAIIFIGVLYFIVLRPAYGRGYVSLTGTTPLESRFFEDLHKGRRGDWSLAEGFFIASGIREEKSLKRAKEWLDQLTIEVEKHLKTERSTDERADQLLRWLHSKVFSEYQASATDALALLRSGRYNCLSSCILYAIIGERIGLNIKGIAVDKHAFCRVLKTARSKRGWDVETTVALGFNPGRNVKISNTVISVPRSQYRNRKELNMWEMIGLIYTNHMGMTGAFPTLKDKLLAFKKAALFSPRDELIQKNVRSVYLMMIQELTRRRKWDQAREHIQSLRATYDPRDKAWPNAVNMLYGGQLDFLNGRKRFSEAEALIARGREAFPTVGGAYWEWSLGRVLSLAAQHYLNQGDAKRGFTLYREAVQCDRRARRAKSALIDSSTLKVTRHNYEASAKNVLITQWNQKRWAEVEKLISIAIKASPQNRELKRMKRELSTLQTQLDEVTLYNQAVEWAKRGEVDRAIDHLNQSIKKTPRSKKLKTLKDELEASQLAQEVVQLAQSGSLKRARSKLRRGLSRYPKNRTLRSLNRQLKRAK